MLYRSAERCVIYIPYFVSKIGVVLKSHAKYVMYVRVWYDAIHYAVYMTDGVLTDSSPPELSRAAKVTEWRSPTSNSDVDFITSTSNVTLSWRGVFRDSQAAIQRYAASISKNFGGRDVAEKQLTSSVSQTTFDNLTLDANDVYYCTVVSYNEAGLIRSAYSDGFKVTKYCVNKCLSHIASCFISFSHSVNSDSRLCVNSSNCCQGKYVADQGKISSFSPKQHICKKRQNAL